MKLGQDRRGDWDDKRIFGWICLGMAIALALVFRALDLTVAFLGSASIAFGLSAFDKD